jgi:Trypsin-co-occurring domain 1
MQRFIIDESAPILVELSSGPGLQRVSLSPQDIVERSTRAIESAMNAIHNMARHVNAAVESLVERPSHIEVEFGLKLDGESGALIAKAGIEASINVKLIWDHQREAANTPSSASRSS